MLSITGVMVLPAYLTSCAYLWKLCEDGEYPTGILTKRSSALLTGILGAVYAIWLIYAAGLNYLLMAVVFIAAGIPIYLWAKREHMPNEKAFSCGEKILAYSIVIVAICAIYAFARGIISL